MNFDPMKPIWLQVMTLLKQQIVTGKLPPGAKLPGGRELALQYGINPNTAARIYQEMEREGMCVTKRGLGTFVTDDTEIIRKKQEEMVWETICRFMDDLAGLGMNKQEAISLIQKEEETHDYK